MSFSIAVSHISIARAAPTRAVRRERKPAVACRAGRDDRTLSGTWMGRRELGAGLVGFLALASPAPASAEEDDGDFKMDYKNYNSGSAAPEAESDLVKRLRAKSEENKEKNDKERFNYDKQYSANMAIIKGTGYVPDNEKDRERLGITRPAECDLPFFKGSPTCKKF